VRFKTSDTFERKRDRNSLCASGRSTSLSSFFSICLLLTKQIEIKPKQTIMKFLAKVLITLLTTGHAMAAFNNNTPTHNLKGRQVEAKPKQTSHNTKTRELQDSVPTGSNEVVIEVTYDDFPLETGWSLMDSAGTVIASQPTGSFTTEGGTVSRTSFVAGGEYIFEMTDSFEDGICCQFGIGEFTITVNGEPVVMGGNGDFGDVVRETFDVLEAPTTAPIRAPTSAPTSAPSIGAPTGNNEVVIEVTYDRFPVETGWSLMDSAGTLIISQPAGSFLIEGGTVSRTALVTVGEYIFEMTDSFGDGICCQFGIGEFTITVNGEPVAIGGNGDFGDVIQETFDVVDAPTSAPTIVPTITLEILEVVEAPTSAPTIPDSRSAAIGGGVASGVVLIAAVAVLF
jgi:hypothetical protein